jgi:MFS family permease
LWVGQAISNIGDTLYNVALLWYVLGTTGSAFAAGGIAVAAGLGNVLGGAGASTVLDHLQPRRVLLAADGARLLFTAVVGLPWLFGTTPPLGMLYALAAASAVATAFHGPARATAVPQLIPVNHLVTANALAGMSASLTNTAVWALSGVIVAALGPALALALNAGTFLVAFLAVWSVTWPEMNSERNRQQRPLAALGAAVHAIHATPALRGMFSLLPIHALAGGCFFAAIAPFLAQQLQGGAALYGIQGAMYGVGIILASWLIGARMVRRIGILYAGGVLLNGLGNVGFALAPAVPALLAAALVAGLGVAALSSGELALLQTAAPSAFRGRIFALAGLLGTALSLLGIALGGWLADHWRAQPVLLLASLVHVCLGLCLAALPALRAARTIADRA